MNQPRLRSPHRLSVSNTVAGLFVDLIEADFLSLTARRKQSDRTRYQRELQVAFPIRTRGHDLLHTNERRPLDMEATPFRTRSGGPMVAQLAIRC
jgi:hypothetical protein